MTKNGRDLHFRRILQNLVYRGLKCAESKIKRTQAENHCNPFIFGVVYDTLLYFFIRYLLFGIRLACLSMFMVYISKMYQYNHRYIYSECRRFESHQG